ncbi:MAG: MBL fold metallo-hydrolase [Myxococcota bacterium]|nr:MBL fold metallo-hydrolase [Myxococcota bacterium]
MQVFKALGVPPKGKRLDRMCSAPNFDGRRFHNTLPTHHFVSKAAGKWLRGAPNRTPKQTVPTIGLAADTFARHPATPHATWLGHSAVLIELDGLRILTDPVLVGRSSPSNIAGPKRFFKSPIAAAELPDLDIVLLSHDHFDHLSYATVLVLKNKTAQWLMPLGVGSHLEAWGVDPDRITELEWWESHDLGPVKLTLTPCRHFSGRTLLDKDRTLWGSWCIHGPSGSLFFSGDTGMTPQFNEIGERMGPFDLTLIESGAYDPAWPDVHLGPEQALDVHRAVRGKVMLPIHWGTFDLALHPWIEPAERLMAADRADVHLTLPIPGTRFSWNSPPTLRRWWPDLPWDTALERPVRATGLHTPHYRSA